MPHPDAESKPYGASSFLPAPDFPSFSVQELMEKGTLLLASSGKEFTKPTGILANSSEVKKARKEAMGRLGLDFLESVGGADDMDLDKELADEVEQDVEMAPAVKAEEDTAPSSPTDEFVDVKVKKEEIVLGRSKSSTPAAAPSPGPLSSAPEDTSALSARERNRLKRKRKPGNAAVVGAPPPPQASGAKYQASAAGPSKYVSRMIPHNKRQLTLVTEPVSWLQTTSLHPNIGQTVPGPQQRVRRRTALS